MDPKTTHVEVLGRRIHEVSGGSGPPLLYLHSAMGEAIWLPHLAALAKRRTVFAPAHPGFLTSQGIDEIRDVEDLVYHYLAYLGAKGWREVAIVGVSLGGWIAAEIAARYPERVSQLVLVSSVGIWLREKPIADLFALDSRFPDRLRQLLFHDTSCPAAQLMARQVGSDLPDEVLTNIMNAFAATAKIGWNPLLHDPRLDALLPRITARTLCLWGANDRVTPPEYGERFAKRIPGARLEIVPECGHMLPFEKEAAFVKAVGDFLG